MLKLLDFSANNLPDHRERIFNVTTALGETLPYNFMFLTPLLCQIVHEYGVCEQGSRKLM